MRLQPRIRKQQGSSMNHVEPALLQGIVGRGNCPVVPKAPWRLHVAVLPSIFLLLLAVYILSGCAGSFHRTVSIGGSLDVYDAPSTVRTTDVQQKEQRR
jgi:hypothetical protein